MNTAVRDLEVAFFKVNSAWFNGICSKDLTNRPTNSVLNTRNLDMILQLKYLTITLWARDFYEVIVDEAEGRINYRLIEIESE